MSDAHNNSNQANVGLVTPAAIFLIDCLEWLSIQRWLSLRIRLLTPRSKLKTEEWASVDFTKRRASAIDAYAIAWLLAEVATSIFLPQIFQISIIHPAIITMAIVRIIEIVQVNMSSALFDALRGRPDDTVATRPRMVILAAINFVELVLCFGIIYGLNWTLISRRGVPYDGLYFSEMTQLTIGYGDFAPHGILRTVVMAQGFVGTLFVILIFGKLVGSLGQMKPLIDERGAHDISQGV